MISTLRFFYLVSLIASLFWFYSCNSFSPYDRSRYLMNRQFRSIISNYAKGDTFRFVNDKVEYQTFVITRIDSLVFDKKGSFINARLSSTVNLYYKQLAPFKEIDESKFISVTTYPDNQNSNISFLFKNSLSINSNDLGNAIMNSSNSELFFLNGTHRIINQKSDSEPKSISELYVKENVGILAFKLNDGDIWTSTRIAL